MLAPEYIKNHEHVVDGEAPVDLLTPAKCPRFSLSLEKMVRRYSGYIA
jgi:hypothetical protein